MKVTKYLIIFVVVFLVVSGSFLWYSGFFASVKINEEEIGPFVLATYEHFGDYDQTQNIIDSIKNILEENNFTVNKTFAIFYNDRQENPTDLLHSIVGCIIEPKDQDKTYVLERNGLIIKKMGKTKCITAEFPYRNQYSLVAGAGKVYRAFHEYQNNNSYIRIPNGTLGVLEIYSDNKIKYCAEIRNKSN